MMQMNTEGSPPVYMQQRQAQSLRQSSASAAGSFRERERAAGGRGLVPRDALRRAAEGSSQRLALPPSTG